MNQVDELFGTHATLPQESRQYNDVQDRGQRSTAGERTDSPVEAVGERSGDGQGGIGAGVGLVLGGEVVAALDAHHKARVAGLEDENVLEGHVGCGPIVKLQGAQARRGSAQDASRRWIHTGSRRDRHSPGSDRKRELPQNVPHSSTSYAPARPCAHLGLVRLGAQLTQHGVLGAVHAHALRLEGGVVLGAEAQAGEVVRLIHVLLHLLDLAALLLGDGGLVRVREHPELVVAVLGEGVRPQRNTVGGLASHHDGALGRHLEDERAGTRMGQQYKKPMK